MNHWVRCALILVLTLFLVLATVFNAVSTPFEAPDEIGHFYYVVHLLQTNRLPVVPADSAPPNYEHEGAQPPLYYLTSALFVRMLSVPLRLDLDDASAPLDINPHSTCARPDAHHNVAYLAHDPHQERFPYEGRVRVIHVVRLWSSLLGMVTVAGVFATARLAFPGAPVTAWLAAAGEFNLPSGNPYLRDIALRSIKASSFPNFPKELDYLQLTFNVVISFEIE